MVISRMKVAARIIVLVAAVVLLAPNSAIAQSKTVEFQARAIEVLNDSAEMWYHADYWITTVMGNAGKQGIPKVIHLGDVVTVQDRTLVANHIFVTQCLERMERGGEVLCEKGQTYCTVVERPEDVPSDEERDRQWIYVKDCHPLPDKTLEGYKSPFVILPPIEWAGGDGSSPKEQAYFHGALETYGFILYGYWPRTPEFEQQFSDFRKCTEDNKRRSWPLSGWLFGTSLDASAAAQLIREMIPIACREYAGKGNGGWEPPRIVSKEGWEGYGDVERRFYVSAYIETALELMVLMEQNEDIAVFTQCMKSKGIDEVLKRLGDMEVEWQFPMPWTISTAVGSTCLGS